MIRNNIFVMFLAIGIMFGMAILPGLQTAHAWSMPDRMYSISTWDEYKVCLDGPKVGNYGKLNGQTSLEAAAYANEAYPESRTTLFAYQLVELFEGEDVTIIVDDAELNLISASKTGSVTTSVFLTKYGHLQQDVNDNICSTMYNNALEESMMKVKSITGKNTFWDNIHKNGSQIEISESGLYYVVTYMDLQTSENGFAYGSIEPTVILHINN